MSTDELLFTTGDLSSALAAGRAEQVIIGDNNYFGAGFEADLVGAGLCLLRPARKGEPERAGARFFKPATRARMFLRVPVGLISRLPQPRQAASRSMATMPVGPSTLAYRRIAHASWSLR
jgi:hypothetical protein